MEPVEGMRRHISPSFPPTWSKKDFRQDLDLRSLETKVYELPHRTRIHEEREVVELKGRE